MPQGSCWWCAFRLCRSALLGWERMDRYGWVPFPVDRLNDEVRRLLWGLTVQNYESIINRAPCATSWRIVVSGGEVCEAIWTSS